MFLSLNLHRFLSLSKTLVPSMCMCHIIHTTTLFEQQLIDISPDGLQVRCTRAIAEALNPRGQRIKYEDNFIINTKFTVPIDDEQHVVAVSCQIYYFVLLPDVEGEDVAFGLKFKKFEGESIRYIGDLIENELEPTIV